MPAKIDPGKKAKGTRKHPNSFGDGPGKHNKGKSPKRSTRPKKKSR